MEDRDPAGSVLGFCGQFRGDRARLGLVDP